MTPIPRLVGMVHLLPLPGSPGFGGSMQHVLEAAIADASELTRAGFPALMIENFGDIPFYADSVPAETIASITVAVDAVLKETNLTVGVNVLRNDVLAALGVAAATRASFVRVNVLTGVMYTDQGPIVGKAAEVLRKRNNLAPGVEIWADVMVKHATAPFGVDIRQSAGDTVERGLADAVIISGSGTGAEPDIHEATIVRSSVPKETRVVVGSGASVDNLSKLMEVADTVIVGSAVKVDADANKRVDPIRAAHFVKAASEHGLT